MEISRQQIYDKLMVAAKVAKENGSLPILADIRNVMNKYYQPMRAKTAIELDTVEYVANGRVQQEDANENVWVPPSQRKAKKKIAAAGPVPRSNEQKHISQLKPSEMKVHKIDKNNPLYGQGFNPTYDKDKPVEVKSKLLQGRETVEAPALKTISKTKIDLAKNFLQLSPESNMLVVMEYPSDDLSAADVEGKVLDSALTIEALRSEIYVHVFEWPEKHDNLKRLFVFMQVDDLTDKETLNSAITVARQELEAITPANVVKAAPAPATEQEQEEKPKPKRRRRRKTTKKGDSDKEK